MCVLANGLRLSHKDSLGLLLFRKYGQTFTLTIMTHTMTNSFNKDKVALLLREYSKDPNCWPELWISQEDANQAEKQAFIELASAMCRLNHYGFNVVATK